MRSIRVKLTVLAGSAALFAVLAAGGLILALRLTDAALDQAIRSQRQLDLLSEMSGRLTDYGLAAIDGAKAAGGDPARIHDTWLRADAAVAQVETALAERVDDARGPLGRTEMAARSRQLAQMRAGLAVLDRQVSRALDGRDDGSRTDAIHGALNAFAANSGPALSLLVEAERRSIEAAHDHALGLSDRLRKAAVAAALAALAAAFLLHRAVTHPLLARLAEIRHAATAIGRGELGTRLPVRSRDELGLLVAAFNRMAARLTRRERRLVEARAMLAQTIADRTADLTAANARLATIDTSRRRFFTDVSHELRTPLTVILGECDIALRSPPASSDQYGPVLRTIRKRAARLHRRVEDLLRVARSESGEIELDFRPVSLGRVLTLAVESFETTARRRDVALALALPDSDVEATADGEWLRQVVEGLIDNALRHAAGATAITVALRMMEDGAEITVADDGCGFPVQDGHDLMARFVRRPREGTPAGYGIGLALARWIVEQHRGTIALARNDGPNGGAKVAVALPLAPKGDTDS